jgi:hypothetical protein
MRICRFLLVAGIAILTTGTIANAQDPNQCKTTFESLRGSIDKAGQAIQAANKRKAPLAEACKLFGTYVEAEAKLLKFMNSMKAQCGVPDVAINNFNTAHGKSSEMRTKVCTAAANGGPAMAQSPSAGLSGAIGSPNYSVDSSGSSTFDTLTGNILKQ